MLRVLPRSDSSRLLLLFEVSFQTLPSKSRRRWAKIVKDKDWTLRIADLTKFPELTGADVHVEIIGVDVKAGKDLFRHYHP